VDWSKVYLVQHRPGGPAQVLLFADVPGGEPGQPTATLSSPNDIARALELAQSDGRFEVFLDFWIDLRKLRHTRDGSTALLSFGLSGGRIATVQVPAEVLQLIRTFRQNASAAPTTPAWEPRGRRKAALIA
jgi:hypothetical protein